MSMRRHGKEDICMYRTLRNEGGEAAAVDLSRSM